MRVHHAPWGLVTGRIVPAGRDYQPVSEEEADWLARMTSAGLANGYETHELILHIDHPLPPLCRARHYTREIPDNVVRTTRPDLCLIEEGKILFTEIKSALSAGPLAQVWKLIAAARGAVSDWQINFLLVFTSDKLIYSSLLPRQVRAILKKIGEDPQGWTIRSANALENRILEKFPRHYPEDAFGNYNYEAMPVAS